MLIRNNPGIDFGELDRRLAEELASPAAVPAVSAPPAPAAPVSAPAPQARRGLRDRLALLRWIAGNLRPLFRRAIGAVYAAEDAKTRVIRVEGQVRRLLDKDSRRLAAETERNARLDMLTQRIETLPVGSAPAAPQAAALAEQVAMLRAEVMALQRQLTRSGAPAAAAALPEDSHLDGLYQAFEDVFRGSRAEIKRRLTPYVGRLGGALGRPVLDIGCGRGEWLELLRESGIAAHGIDSNAAAVARCMALGLDARHADLATHLDTLEAGSLGAVTAFHVAEHLTFPALVGMVDAAWRVLAPGGLLILETPNPETMRVGATTFYNDPTHRNPVMPEPLAFILRHRGFVETEILRLHPFTDGLLEADTADAELLNRVLFGPQDFAVIARRP